MRQTVTLLLFALLGLPSLSTADCIRDRYGQIVCGAGECVPDQDGNIFCAPVGGSALRDNHGEVFCGVGECTKDQKGKIWCSTVPGGGAATSAYGEVKCYKGCEAATQERCEPGQ
jgi:hypothetical protein